MYYIGVQSYGYICIYTLHAMFYVSTCSQLQIWLPPFIEDLGNASRPQLRGLRLVFPR